MTIEERLTCLETAVQIITSRLDNLEIDLQVVFLGNPEDIDQDDRDADRYALASCGFGTDEDYGGCIDDPFE